jgi:hypothetical protein
MREYHKYIGRKDSRWCNLLYQRLSFSMTSLASFDQAELKVAGIG